mgnify:CR=1 FL=1
MGHDSGTTPCVLPRDMVNGLFRTWATLLQEWILSRLNLSLVLVEETRVEGITTRTSQFRLTGEVQPSVVQLVCLLPVRRV